MTTATFLGIRVPGGRILRRWARPRPAVLAAPCGVTQEVADERWLRPGDWWQHPRLGPVQVVWVQRWRA